MGREVDHNSSTGLLAHIRPSICRSARGGRGHRPGTSPPSCFGRARSFLWLSVAGGADLAGLFNGYRVRRDRPKVAPAG